ncbi:MAG: hypothetical protein WC375_12930 [Methanomassiliicoccales archaeon]|jgi:hypothetical protein
MEFIPYSEKPFVVIDVDKTTCNYVIKDKETNVSIDLTNVEIDDLIDTLFEIRYFTIQRLAIGKEYEVLLDLVDQSFKCVEAKFSPEKSIELLAKMKILRAKLIATTPVENRLIRSLTKAFTRVATYATGISWLLDDINTPKEANEKTT